MHADTNVVKLSGIEPNSVPTTISAALGLNDNSVSVANTTFLELKVESQQVQDMHK